MSSAITPEAGKKNIPYNFSEQLILRTPALPLDVGITEKTIDDLLQDTSFLEAIYLASPVLFKECIKLNKGTIISEKEIQKLKLSLAKYYQRMCSRCTPFGLFSGCSVVKWKEGSTKIVLADNSKLRHTRLDMHFLCALSQKFALLPYLKNRILYYPNNSIYVIGDEVRYIEYKYLHGRRMHQISSVSNTEYLQKILQQAEKGVTLKQAKQLLLQDDVTDKEAAAFIDELLQSQILISELEPAVTGDEFIHQVAVLLKKYNTGTNDELAEVANTLNQIINLLAGLDANSDNKPESYHEIILLVQSLNIEYDETKLFQTDLFTTVLYGSVDKKLQPEILSALEFFNKLYPDPGNENLKSFIRRFKDRYEDAAMPLQEVLDTETGIGYPEGSGSDISPLTDELKMPGTGDRNSYSIQWNSLQQLLFEKLSKAVQENSYSIQFSADDLKNNKADWDNLPPSMSVMFRLIDAKENKIVIDSAGGTSAANLAGRFAHGNAEIYNLVTGITAQEQQLNPGFIFAEIAHLPENRTGNILLRPVFREYEIPYLSKSSLLPENQIALNDLQISVEGNHIKLFSKKLNKQIIPRLSTAHNFSFNALPVYQFLCDLQSQNLRHGFAFHWGSMAVQFKFLPRVEYRNMVLYEATWQFGKKDFADFVTAIEKNETVVIDNFISQWKIPRHFLLADSDNELLVDIKNKISLLAFAKTIKNRSSIILKEFLFDTSGAITGEKGQLFNNQLIASLVKTEKIYGQPSNQTGKSVFSNVKRKFEPGSEWLYFKFYCGSKSAEKLLAELIGPLTANWLKRSLIQKWFFIRYSDPSFHLRVRFHLTDKRDAGMLMNELAEKIAEARLSEFIWKTQVDTYYRELERYGPDCIEMSEELFYQDSLNKLRFIELTEGDERENIRWLWGLAMTDALLNAFEFNISEKQSLLRTIKDIFSKEFHADKNLLLQVNKKYNFNKEAITSILTGHADHSNTITDLIIAEVSQYKKNSKHIVAKIKYTLTANLTNTLNEVAGSYIHMALNRLFPSQARLQEYILYEFLNRYYLSILKQLAIVTTTGMNQEKI
jgi:thiopeptide-type bacteriocin biosynthesis protein